MLEARRREASSKSRFFLPISAIIPAERVRTLSLDQRPRNALAKFGQFELTLATRVGFERVGVFRAKTHLFPYISNSLNWEVGPHISGTYPEIAGKWQNLSRTL